MSGLTINKPFSSGAMLINIAANPVESSDVLSLKQENTQLKARLESAIQERDNYRRSLRELQKLQDYLIIKFDQMLKQQIAKTTSQDDVL